MLGAYINPRMERPGGNCAMNHFIRRSVATVLDLARRLHVPFT